MIFYFYFINNFFLSFDIKNNVYLYEMLMNKKNEIWNKNKNKIKTSFIINII